MKLIDKHKVAPYNNEVKYYQIIDSIKNNPYITQEELAEIVGIARLNIIKNMKKLQEQNIIKRIGADKNGYWQIVDKK